MRFPFCFPFLFLCLAASSSSAQIVLQQIGKEGVLIQNQTIGIDIQSLAYIKVLTDSMHNEGFLEFSIDSMKSVEDKTYLFIHQGPRYYWRAIQKPLPDIAHSSILFEVGKWEAIIKKNIGKPATIARRNGLLGEINSLLNTQGYPFASTTLHILKTENGALDVQIKVDFGTFIRFDSILLKGDKPLATSFLFRYLDLKKGAAFSTEMLEKMTTRIAALPYVELIDAKPVLSGEKVSWMLNMKKK